MPIYAWDALKWVFYAVVFAIALAMTALWLGQSALSILQVIASTIGICT